jgi:predicted nuclease of predicted toxin-antitoxin system
VLPLLFDQHLRQQIQDGLRLRCPNLDMVRVQDIGLDQATDSVILEKAATFGRIVISSDKKTLAVDAAVRIAQGLPMPGVIILLPRCTDAHAIDELAVYAVCGNPGDLEGQIQYIPSHP